MQNQSGVLARGNYRLRVVLVADRRGSEETVRTRATPRTVKRTPRTHFTPRAVKRTPRTNPIPRAVILSGEPIRDDFD